MRLIVEFQKAPSIRFVAHLDLMRALTRALRRARLPVSFSGGFHPHPRFSLATALSVGVASSCECLEMLTDEDVEPRYTVDMLNDVLPEGLRALRAGSAPADGAKLMAMVTQSEYIVHLPRPIDIDRLQSRIPTFLAQDSIFLEFPKKGKIQVIDAKPMLYALAVLPGSKLHMRVQFGSQGSLRPEWLCAAFLAYCAETIEVHDLLVDRTGLLTGPRDSPVPLFDAAVGKEVSDEAEDTVPIPTWPDPHGAAGG